MGPFVVIVGSLIVGLLLRRLPRVPEETGTVLNAFVIYVSLPALILVKIPTLTWSSDLLVPAIMPWGMLVFSCALVLALSRFLRWDRGTTGCMLLLTPLGNTSFLGIPMVEAFFGERGVPYALLYDQLGSFLALATYGSLILALYGITAERPTAPSVVRKVLVFPPLVALVVAFAFKPLGYWPVVADILEALASTLVPLVMIAVGYQLTLRLDRRVASQLGVGLALKMVVAPLAALLLCRLLALEGEAVQVSIFEAGMPPMVSAGVLAISGRLSPALAAALVGVGIVASFVTLPALYALLV